MQTKAVARNRIKEDEKYGELEVCSLERKADKANWVCVNNDYSMRGVIRLGVLSPKVLLAVSLHFSVVVLYITRSKFAGSLFIYSYIRLLIDRTCKFGGTVTSLKELKGGVTQRNRITEKETFFPPKFSGPLVGPKHPPSQWCNWAFSLG